MNWYRIALLLLSLLLGGCCTKDAPQGLKPDNTGFQIGDTVIVFVIGHGQEVGVIRQFFRDTKIAYVDFRGKCCNGWYDPDFSKFFPYKSEWDKQ